MDIFYVSLLPDYAIDFGDLFITGKRVITIFESEQISDPIPEPSKQI